MSDDPPAGSDDPARARSGKSADAFRTISEVAQFLELPQHVLRFWETKFPQVRPLKRGGGRRYYRPADVELLKRIRDLLYVDGYTIKGVQKLLRQSGSVRHFIDETEAGRLPTGDDAPARTPPGRAPQPPPAQAPADDSWRRDLAELRADLAGLRDKLLDAAS